MAGFAKPSFLKAGPAGTAEAKPSLLRQHCSQLRRADVFQHVRHVGLVNGSRLISCTSVIKQRSLMAHSLHFMFVTDVSLIGSCAKSVVRSLDGSTHCCHLSYYEGLLLTSRVKPYGQTHVMCIIGFVFTHFDFVVRSCN